MTCKHVVDTRTNAHGGVTLIASVGTWSCPWCEIEQLRGNLSLAEEGLANYASIRQESLTWAVACECECRACIKLYDVIRGAAPQSGDIAAR
jgi:hypothetical protein